MVLVARWAVVALLTAVAAAVGAAPAVAQVAPKNCTIPIRGTPTTFNRCSALFGTVNLVLYWNISDTLTAAFTSNSTGWAALAFSGTGQLMVAPSGPPVRAVVGLSTSVSPTEASAAVYSLLARSPAGVQPLPASEVTAAGYSNVAAERTATGLTVTFTRNISAEPVIGNGFVNILWAEGPPPTSATTLMRHSARQAGTLRFEGRLAVPRKRSDDEDVCFPADAAVEAVGRGLVAMADLRIGDVVAVGGGRTSRVYAFSHADADAVSSFIELSTGGEAKPLRLSPGHYLPVNGRLAAARTVVVGDVLMTGAGPAAVTAVSTTTGVGLYNPHTVDGGLLVDGIRTSCYTTSVDPAVAAALLAPARWATAALGPRAGGWVEAVTAWGRFAAAALPSGRDAL